MAKLSLAEIVKKEKEYSSRIETDQRKLEAFNRQAEVQGNPNYEIERRARLASSIDEFKLAYRELMGYEYQGRKE